MEAAWWAVGGLRGRLEGRRRDAVLREEREEVRFGEVETERFEGDFEFVVGD
jgi:hypothetical protein